MCYTTGVLVRLVQLVQLKEEEMQGYTHSVYILLTRTSSILSRLIRILTRAAYTHAALALDEEFEETYSFTRRNPRLIWPAGLARESLWRGLYLARRDPPLPCIPGTAYRRGIQSYSTTRAGNVQRSHALSLQLSWRCSQLFWPTVQHAAKIFLFRICCDDGVDRTGAG